MRARTRIVDILRDFAEVHDLVRELAEKHRAEALHFPEVTALIGDDESSGLFRLKERCHALFREVGRSDRGPTHREALFDLAVGSLFHEAMKLRENLYQREVYGPRVRALHSGAGQESKALFDEFEKMLGSVGTRLDEGIRELESLTQRTADQLRLLIAEAADAGIARFLSENVDRLDGIFGAPLNLLLEEAYGTVSNGLELAARSYLASGSFQMAAECFDRAAAEPDANPELGRLRDYALGIEAYVERDYATSVRRLVGWEDSAPPDPGLLPLARDTLAGIVQLAGSDLETLRGATALLERLGPVPD